MKNIFLVWYLESLLFYLYNLQIFYSSIALKNKVFINMNNVIKLSSKKKTFDMESLRTYSTKEKHTI